MEVERSYDNPISFDQWAQLVSQFSYQGLNYTLPSATQEEVSSDFAGLARSAYKANGVVFACLLVRMLLFSEARFQFRQIRDGRPGDLFGTSALNPLETPWKGATTGDLLSRAEQYASIAGNAFFVARAGGVRPLRPDWVTLIIGSDSNDPEIGAWDAEADVVGYAYQPGGPGSGRDPVFYTADEVAHYAPIPDPEARFRGMSPLQPIVREIMGDKAATQHKLSFFEHGATPQMVVKLDVPDLGKFQQWIDAFKEEHEGAANAYKTLYLGAGADAKVVGADLKQLDFKVTQGAGETRIAAALGVPPVIVGLSEGLQAATYSNYGQARRRFADGTMRPLWRNMAGSLARIIDVPTGAELWYDDRDISALQEDRKDAAEIQATNATAITSLITAGFDPASTVQAVEAGDLSRLKHTGLVSVQLLPPGTVGTPPTTTTPTDSGKNAQRDQLLELALWNQLRAKREPLAITMPEQSPPVVNVTVERQEPANVSLTVPPSEAPVVNVTVEGSEPPQTHIHEGAFRSETTVEPARVDVHVEPAAVNVEPTIVNVAPAEVTVEAARAPDVNVTVEPARLEAGAVQVDVAAPSVTVEAPPPTEVNVDVHVPPPPARRNAVAERGEDGKLHVTYDTDEEDTTV